MLLDNLISHLEELRKITGGKIHVHAELESETCNLKESNLTVLKTEDYISIRNF